MKPRLRTFALTAHIVFSVGWLGAVLAVLALAVVGLSSRDAQMVRAAHLTMEAMGRLVLIPLAFASLLTGLIQSLGTAWGLLRHYWVVAKLLLTALATVVLVLYTQTLAYLAGVAAKPTLSAADLKVLGTPSVALHAGAALLVLLVITVLAMYKPRGMTRYGRAYVARAARGSRR